MPLNDQTARPLWPKLALAAAIAGALALFFVLGGDEWLTLERLRADRARLLAYAELHFWTLLVLWGLLYAGATALSIPGATVLSLATGFLFGRFAGTALIVSAATLGATGVFLGARYLFAVSARERLERSPRAARVLAGIDRGAFHYLLFLRLVPIVPFWLINLAAAFTRMPVRAYVLATVIGIVPGSFVYANLGRSFGTIESLHGLVSVKVVAAFALLGLFALLPVIWRTRFVPAAKSLGE